MHYIITALGESWRILLESSVYMIFGLLFGGMIKVFLSPAFVARHLGRGRYRSVFKAALLGVPLPLCSCSVLPTAASLRGQGANRGATTSFLISTPESGVDSMALTYALMDPLMTVARPVAAVTTAIAAGALENRIQWDGDSRARPEASCPVDGCCGGAGCDPAEHQGHHGFWGKILAGVKYAFGELWGELAGLFLVGVLLAGAIGAFLPPELLSRYMGGGLLSMLIMLAVGIPIYICATASTPIAASLVMAGVSPGAALVFLLAGPATNITSLTMLLGVLGKRATVIYLASIAVFAVAMGLLLDLLYGALGMDAKAVMGAAGEAMPLWLQWAAVLALLVLAAKPVGRGLWARLSGHGHEHHHHCHSHGGCSCGSSCSQGK